MRRFVFTIVLVTGLFSGIASAHDFWVEPDEFTPSTTSSVYVRLKEGVGFKGNTLPYIPEWFRDFSATTTEGREPVISIMGDDPAAELTLTAGQMLLGYQSVRSFVELDAEKFNSYLEDEGIEFIREARRAAGEDDAPAPEYFVRCAKTLLQSPEPGAKVYNDILGYTLELVPLADPYELTAGDTLEFELLFRDEPIEGLQLQAFTREAPDDVQKIRTNSEGKAVVTLSTAGTWMVKAVQIQPIIGDPKARWQSYWATYLFTLD